MRTRRARQQREYYARAAYARRKRLQATTAVLAAAAASSGSIPPEWVRVVEALGPIVIQAIIQHYGSSIQFQSVRRLFDVDRSYAFAIERPDIQLTAR